MSRSSLVCVAALAAWAIAVVVAGGTPLRASLPFGDKVQHVLAWAAPGVLLTVFARWEWRRASVATVIVFVSATGMALGALDELVQSLVPGRDADLRDLIADAVGLALGIAAGFAIAAVVERFRPGASAPDRSA